MTPALDLTTAIAAVEAAETVLATADSSQIQAQTKFEAAAAAKASADTADADAVAGFNASLDALIAAATAAKISR